MSVRLVVALLALALACALLPGCADGPPSLVLWHSMRGDQEDALARLARAYEAETGTRVELLAIPFDAFSAKIEAAVPHDHGPDVFIDAHERLGSFKKNGLVAAAADAFPDEDVARYDATSVRAVTVDGARWGVPLASKCLAIYVNEALVPQTPRTVEEIAALKSKLPPGAFPLAYPAHDPYFHAAFLHGFGGRMLDEADRYGFVGGAAEGSLDLVRDLLRGGAMPEEATGALVNQLFSAGKAAIVVNGPWFAADLKTDVRYRVEPLPSIGATGAPMRPFLTVDVAFLTPAGARRVEARRFARWLGGEESAKVRATVGHQSVTTLAAWNDPAVAQDRLLAAFHDAAANAEPMPTSPAMRATWVPTEQAIQKVLRGDATARASTDEARKRFDDAMRPPPPAPSPAPLLVAVWALIFAGALMALRRAREPGFRARVRASIPAYKYVLHAAIAVTLLVVVPLFVGALTSFFVGTRSDPRYVGLGNYFSILTARGGSLFGYRSFYTTLLVTVAWTIVNVALHVAIGLVVGLALARPLGRVRAIYRVLLILPWAVPSYVTALAWKGMFHRQFGAVNALLGALGVQPVSWFASFSTAFAANVATNVWLGFPFMMVVTLGALTAIPREVLEAAEVDGATRWQRFRLVTFPLLKNGLLPSVILGSVWTFNMFNVVFLVSGGEPDESTDILVSAAYRWAFTRDAQYGYAAAYAVLIFLILAMGTRLLNRLGGKEAAT